MMIFCRADIYGSVRRSCGVSNIDNTDIDVTKKKRGYDLLWDVKHENSRL